MLSPDHLLNGSAPTEILLQGPFGEKERARITNVSLKLIDDTENKNLFPLTITCAVTDKLASNFMILSQTDYSVLLDHNNTLLPDVTILSDTQQLIQPYVTDPSDIIEAQLIGKIDAEEVKQGNTLKQFELDVNFDIEHNADLKKLQEEDPSLARCFQSAKAKDSKFFIDPQSQLLFRHKLIGGLLVNQLVLPETKRHLVLETAHDSLWANHLAVDKTLLCIQNYFFWIDMHDDVAKYVSSCPVCQRKRRLMKTDQIPIQAIDRAPTPVFHLNLDLIGPISPKSSRGHEYILCVVDNYSRWAECVPLKGLTAKEMVDALISIFCRIGVSQILQNDNGNNLVSGLNRELYVRLGIELCCSTPLFPNQMA